MPSAPLAQAESYLLQLRQAGFTRPRRWMWRFGISITTKENAF